MANGWLNKQDQQFLFNVIRALENAGPTKCISVAVNFVEKFKNMMYISCD